MMVLVMLLGVYIRTGEAKNMPDLCENRNYDLWKAYELSYSAACLRICELSNSAAFLVS